MKSSVRGRARGAAGTVLKAAQFKAKALAVMRRVRDTGETVTVTSRGQALVRIEPVRSDKVRIGYGCMKGTVEFLVSDDQIVKIGAAGPWGTLPEWDEGIAR